MTRYPLTEMDLARQLDEATAAAQNAFRDTARLIRLLTVLSSPSAPEELLGQALTVLSEVFIADVVCVVGVVGDRYLVTSACGLADDDPSYMDGWALGPAAAEAVGRRHAVACHVEGTGEDVPAPLSDLGLRTAAFIPMSAHPDQCDELLLLFRSTGEPFSGTDLHVLVSVAQRLSIAAENRERAVAVERLAQTGHLLVPHLDFDSLVDKGAELLAQLTMSDHSCVVSVRSEQVYYWAHRGASYATMTATGYPAQNMPGWEAMQQGRPWTGTVVVDRSGIPRTVLCVPIMRDGTPIALLYAARDHPRPYGSEVVEIATIFATYLGTAMENAGLYRELRHRATRDPLTGLANRELAGQRLDEKLANGSTSFVGLLFCDLDGFKAVNDRLGHDAGDRLLRQVAARLQEGLRPDDLLARFGGDEFVVVLGEVQCPADVTAVGRRVMCALSQPFTLGGERVMISVSIGGALGARGHTTSRAMLRDADAAMYVAKSHGPGAIEVFGDGASDRSLGRSLDRLSIRAELVRAMERNEIEVCYQPIVELDTGRPVGFEALARWNHPERGSIPADTFIPLAEETGQIVPLGNWMLTQACRQLAAWHRLPGWSELRLNLNVSAAQLGQDDAPRHLLSLIRSAGVNPADVWFEVTAETHAGNDVTVAAQQLRHGRVHFALDGFGRSSSTLTTLQQFPADGLKIDRSFVDGLTAGVADPGIIRAILAMATSLRLEVVADGVALPAERDALLALGCRLGQGRLFAPALPAGDATRLLVASAPRATCLRDEPWRGDVPTAVVSTPR